MYPTIPHSSDRSQSADPIQRAEKLSSDHNKDIQPDETPLPIVIDSALLWAQYCLFFDATKLALCPIDSAERKASVELAIKKQIKHWLGLEDKTLNEMALEQLYDEALHSVETLFDWGDDTPVARWNKWNTRLKTLIALRAALLKFYGHHCPVVRQRVADEGGLATDADKTLQENFFRALSHASFDLVYIQFARRALIDHFDLTLTKKKLTGAMQIFAVVNQAGGLVIPCDFFRHLEMANLSALQQRYFDFAALLDYYLLKGDWFLADFYSIAAVVPLQDLRQHFLSRLAEEITLQQIFDSLLHPLAPAITKIRYDTFAFVNAKGKDFSYFTHQAMVIAQQRGIKLAPEVIINALKKYFHSLGESCQFPIGSVAQSLHSICLRYDGVFGQDALTLPLTLTKLKQRLDEHERRWAQHGAEMMKPSIMAGLHLMHSRAVHFVDRLWGARLWDEKIKTQMAEIIAEDGEEWGACQLPFADPQQPAADAFHDFLSFQPIDIEKTACVKNIMIYGEGSTRLAAKRQKIRLINRKIQSLRQKYLAEEWLISTGDLKKDLTAAEGYFKQSLLAVLEPTPAVSAEQVALIALQRMHPKEPITFFTERTQTLANYIYKPGTLHITHSVNRIEVFLNDAKFPRRLNYYPEAQKKFNQVIDDFIKHHQAWILARAYENLRLKGGPFGLSDHQAEIHQLIKRILANKIHQEHHYDATQMVISFLPFIGAGTLLLEGIWQDNVISFLLGGLFLSLDTIAFFASPLRATLGAGELISEAASRTEGLQSLYEQTQLKAVSHVVQQLHVEDQVIENIIKTNQLHPDTFNIAPSQDFLRYSQSNIELAKNIIRPSRADFFSEPLEHPPHFTTNTSSVNPGFDGHQFNIVDDIDRQFEPTVINEDPVVNFTKKVMDIEDLAVRDVQNRIKTVFHYHSDLPVLVADALRANIAQLLDLAAQHSSIFRRLLRIKERSGSPAILFNLSDSHLYPRAYPKLPSSEELTVIAKEDCKQQKKNAYIAALKAANSGISNDEITQALFTPTAQAQINQLPELDLIKAQVKLLQEKHQAFTIDMLPNDRISALSYFSAEGEQPFTLSQAVFHEVIHMMTGIKDISSQVISGLSPAAKGVGPVDHLTDLILFEIGEDLPIRVLYASEELRQSSQDARARLTLIKQAAQQTEAQQRAIATAFKNSLEQATIDSIILGQPIQQRTTVKQAINLTKQKTSILRRYYSESTNRLAKETDLQEVLNGRVGLLKNLNLGGLPDHLRLAYQTDFKSLLTKSEMMISDALVWWNKSRLARIPWKIRVERVENAMGENFEPISINLIDQVVDVRHHDQLVYLSERGIKPLETSRLAALTLQKLFNHPFNETISQIRYDERGWDVFRVNQIFAQLGRHKLTPQVSYRLISHEHQSIKEQLLAVNHHARLAAWKEDAFLNGLLLD